MCAVRERRPELVAHAHGHVMVHRPLLCCACEANHELAELVDTQRSSRSRRASTDSSFSFGDLALQGNGVEVDAEHGSSPSHCCLTRERRRRRTRVPVRRDCHPERRALAGSNVTCPRRFTLRDRKDEISSAEDDLQS